MEDLNQNYGFVLYRKQFPNGLNGTLELHEAMDYTIVMVNGKTVAKAFRGYGPDSNKVTLNETGPVTLDLLVYNLGRISVVVSDRTQNLARKGLIGGATLDGKTLAGWEMYSLPYASGVENYAQYTGSFAGHAPNPPGATLPGFYHATFTVDQVGGTFLDMSNWGFGAVWVNGHNLGRFWDRGGLRSLFLPASWLKQGQNDIQVLELDHAPKVAEITGVKNIVKSAAEPFAVRLDLPPTF
jgi:beta-galactosidase